MANDEIYDSMIQKKGLAYHDGQILDSDRTHYREPIDNSPGRLAGNSRAWGDASPEVQSRSVDALIQASQRGGLSQRQTAYVLAMARVESGFNPDAAAGTTTAFGLGQFIDATGKGYGITSSNRGDITKQAEALVATYKDDAALAKKNGQGDEYIYKYHHDGPVGDYGGLDLSKQYVMPFVGDYEKFVKRYEKTHVVVPPDLDFDKRNQATVGKSVRQYSADNTLKLGAHGIAVGALQADLAALGYTDNRGKPLQPDGHYGRNTEAAVMAFQSDHGLHSDGVAGKNTLDALQGQRQLLSGTPALAPELPGSPHPRIDRIEPANRAPVQRDARAPALPDSATPSVNPYADPRHPNHGLYAELRERIPNASENRIVECTAACHMAGIRSGELGQIHLRGKEALVFAPNGGAGGRAEVALTSPAPPIQQTIQHVQGFEQNQQMAIAQMHAQQQQAGPVMGGPRMG